MRTILTAWHDFMRFSVRRRRALSNFLTHTKHVHVESCFVAWGEISHSKRTLAWHRKRSVSLLQKRLHRNLLQSAVRAWNVLASANQKGEKRLVRAIRVLVKIRSRYAFNWWRTLTIRCVRAIIKFTRRTLARRKRLAWNAWRMELASTRRKFVLTRRTIHHWVSLTLSKAFHSWIEQCAYLKKQRKTSLRIILRMLQSSVSHAWQCWCDTHYETKRKHQILTSCIRKMSRINLYSAFCAWRDWQDEQHMRIRLALRCIHRMHNHLMVKAFECWYDTCTFLASSRVLLQKHIVRMRNALLFSAFSSFNFF